MYCHQCGNQIPDSAPFCPYCGTPLLLRANRAQERLEGYEQPVRTNTDRKAGQKQAKKQKKPAGSRKGLPGWLMLIIGVVAAVALVTGLVFGGIMNIRGINTPSSKVEGKGFDSPEEAVIAYAEALKAQDFDQLLSTYAVESLCDNFDTKKYIEWREAYTFSDYKLYPITPTDNLLIKKENVEKCKLTILNKFNYQMLTLANAASGGRLDAVVSDETIYFEDSSQDRSEMSDLLRDLQNLPDFSTMEIGEIVYGEVLTDNYLKSTNIEYMIKKADSYGAEGIKSMALTFSVDGMKCILCMDTIRYNGKWYNLVPLGNLVLLMDLNITSGGICVSSDQENYKAFQDRIVNQEQILSQWKADLSNLKEKWEAEDEIPMSFDELIEFFSMTELMK